MAFKPYSAPSDEEQLASAYELANEIEDELRIAIDGLQWVVAFKGDSEMMLKAAEETLEKLKGSKDIIRENEDI